MKQFDFVSCFSSENVYIYILARLTKNKKEVHKGQKKDISWDNFTFDLENFTKRERYTLEYLFHHFVFNGQPFMRFKQVSKEHLELGIAHTISIRTGKKRGRFSYNKALNSLIQKGIIERTEYYSKEKRIAKSIRFTRDFVRAPNNVEIIEKQIEKKRQRTSNRFLSKTDTAIRKLNIKKGVDIKDLVNTIVTQEYILKKYVEVDLSEVPDGHYKLILDGVSSEGRYSVKYAKSIADKKGHYLLYHKRERQLIQGEGDMFVYIQDKVAEIKLLYSYLLSKIESRDYFPTTISDTNKRLTSFFTVFPNVLLPYVELQRREIVTWDIANSQFCFLANILSSYRDYKRGERNCLYKKIEQEKEYTVALSESFPKLLDSSGQFTSSTKAFIKAACTGKLYELVAKLAGIQRYEAKKAMFLIAFSSHRYNPPLKKKVRNVFPEIIDFIDEFKRIKPNESKSGFAVWLQRIESSICVSEILHELIKKKNNFIVLTRHDSFTTNTKEKNKFRDRIEAILDTFLLSGYQLRLERH